MAAPFSHQVVSVENEFKTRALADWSLYVPPAEAGFTRIRSWSDYLLLFDYVWPTQATRPLPEAGGVRFDTTTALATTTTQLANGALSFSIRFTLRSLPGTAFSLFSLIQSATRTFAELLASALGGAYTNITFHPNADLSGSLAVGFSPTLDTNEHVLSGVFTNAVGPSNPGDTTFLFDGAGQTTVASGPLGQFTTPKGGLGARVDAADAITLGADVDIAEMIAYASALSGGDFTQLDDYMRGAAVAPPAGTAVWLRPQFAADALWTEARQSGDLEFLSDSVTGSPFPISTPGALATRPLLQHASSTDGKPSIEFIATSYVQVDNLDFGGKTGVTIAGWFRTTSLATSQRMLVQLPAALNDNVLAFSFLTTGEVRALFPTSAADVATRLSTNTGAVVANRWYFGVLEYDGTQGTDSARVRISLVDATTMAITRYSVALGNAAMTGSLPAAIRTPSGAVPVTRGHFSVSMVGEQGHWFVLEDQGFLDDYQILALARLDQRSG